jgi:hypothetical protein
MLWPNPDRPAGLGYFVGARAFSSSCQFSTTWISYLLANFDRGEKWGRLTGGLKLGWMTGLEPFWRVFLNW